MFYAILPAAAASGKGYRLFIFTIIFGSPPISIFVFMTWMGMGPDIAILVSIFIVFVVVVFVVFV